MKEGKKIPRKKLEAAAKKGGKEGKRARLAETLEGMHHGKHSGGSYEKEMDREDKRSTLVKPAPRGPVPTYPNERGNAKMDRHMAKHIKVSKS